MIAVVRSIEKSSAAVIADRAARRAVFAVVPIALLVIAPAAGCAEQPYVIAASPASPAPPPRPADRGAIEAAIARITAGLVTAVAVRGAAVPHHTLDARMAHHRVPGVSVAVIDDGHVAWARGFGVIAKGGAPVTEGTLFQAASISKPVAAAVALALVERGALDLDGDVTPRLRSWSIPGRPPGVTLRRILSHSAGFNVHGFPGYAQGSAAPSLLDVLKGSPPAKSDPIRIVFLPGAEQRYSGGGYAVLQLLIEDTTARPFADVAREMVLAPSGMTTATFAQPLPPSLAPVAARGHTGKGDTIDGGAFVFPELAAAGLWSTPSDLAAFAIDLMRSHRALGAPMATEMLTPHINGAGLGVSVGGRGDAARFEHSGSNPGFKARLVAYVHAGQGAIVMTNGDGGAALAGEVLRAIAGEYRWPGYPGPRLRDEVQLPRAALAPYEGEYDFGKGGMIRVSMEGERLVAVSSLRTIPLFAEAMDRFFMLDEPATLTFARGPSGEVATLFWDQGDKHVTGVRTPTK